MKMKHENTCVVGIKMYVEKIFNNFNFSK